MSALDHLGAPDQNLENDALYDAPLAIGVALDIDKLFVIVLDEMGSEIGESGYKGSTFEIEDISKFTTARELITKVTDRLQCSPNDVRIWPETEYYDFLHRESRTPWSKTFPKYPIPIDFPSDSRVCAFFETNAVVVERVAESERQEEQFPSSVEPKLYDLSSWLKKQQADWKCESVEDLPKDRDWRVQLVVMETARTVFNPSKRSPSSAKSSKSSESNHEKFSGQNAAAAESLNSAESNGADASGVQDEAQSSPPGPVTSTTAFEESQISRESPKCSEESKEVAEDHVDSKEDDMQSTANSEQSIEDDQDDDMPDLAELTTEAEDNDGEDVPSACVGGEIKVDDYTAKTHACTLFATLGYLFQDLTGVRGLPQPSIFRSPSVRLQLRSYALKHGKELDQVGFFGEFLSSQAHVCAKSEEMSPHQIYADRVMEESYLGDETDLWLAALSEGCLLHVFDVRQRRMKVYGEGLVKRYGNPQRVGPRFVASLARWADGNYDPICFCEAHGAIPVQREKPFHVDKAKRIFAWMFRQKKHWLAPARNCAGCSRREAEPGTYLRCGQCRMAYYCHEKCQRAHWKKDHRKVCRPWNSLIAGQRLEAEEEDFRKTQEEERKNPRNDRRPEVFRRPDEAGGGYSGIRNDRRGGRGRRRGRGRGNRGRTRGGYRSRGRGRGYRGKGRGGAYRGGRGRGGRGRGVNSEQSNGYREHRDNPHRPNFGYRSKWRGVSVGGDDNEDNEELSFNEWQGRGCEGSMPDAVASQLKKFGDKALKGEIGANSRDGRRGRDGRLRSREERARANEVTMDDSVEVLGSGATKQLRSSAKIDSPELMELAATTADEPERDICDFTEEELANYKPIGDEPPKYKGGKFVRMANVMPTNDEEDIGVLMTGSGFQDGDLSTSDEDLTAPEDSSDEELSDSDTEANGKDGTEDKSKKVEKKSVRPAGDPSDSEEEEDSDDEDPESWDAYS